MNTHILFLLTISTTAFSFIIPTTASASCWPCCCRRKAPSKEINQIADELVNSYLNSTGYASASNPQKKTAAIGQFLEGKAKTPDAANALKTALNLPHHALDNGWQSDLKMTPLQALTAQLFDTFSTCEQRITVAMERARLLYKHGASATLPSVRTSNKTQYPHSPLLIAKIVYCMVYLTYNNQKNTGRRGSGSSSFDQDFASFYCVWFGNDARKYMARFPARFSAAEKATIMRLSPPELDIFSDKPLSKEQLETLALKTAAISAANPTGELSFRCKAAHDLLTMFSNATS